MPIAANSIIEHLVDCQVTASDDGGHSAIAYNSEGDFSISGLGNDGRETSASQSRGSYHSLRQGARKEISGSLTLKKATGADGFERLVMGQVAGFVSVVADMGDAIGVDLTVDMSYGTSTKIYILRDVVLTQDMSVGDPTTDSYSYICYGPITLQDDDGTHTLVSSR